MSELRGGGGGGGAPAFPQVQTRGEAPSPARGEFPFGPREVIQLLPENQVHFTHRGVSIDLGGIAKGFAVDRAIEALRHHGIAEGLVNAGGDLAAFGPRRHPVDIRDPRHPDRPMCHVVLSNAALASSAGQYDPSRSDRPSSSAIVDPLTGRPSHTIRGATVCAPCCVIADALTKVVMNVGEGAAALLEHYGASALFVSAQGRVHVTTDWKDEVRFAA
jgi:thiamine biosynthesis lipoprotein